MNLWSAASEAKYKTVIGAGTVSIIRYINRVITKLVNPVSLHRSSQFKRFGKTHVILSRTQISGNGRLDFGVQWPGGKKNESQIVARDGAKITVDGNFAIYSGAVIWINEQAKLSLGSGFINNNLNMSVFSGVDIGHNVVISENVLIRDSDNHSLDGSNPTAKITIGDNVWIGVNVIILKGVKIGEGAVIAAGSLVNRDVPAHSLVAGVPARVKKTNISWKD